LLAVAATAVIARLWQERRDISDLNWPVAATTARDSDSVTVTWFGITTMLFDDGETQILIDGTFSRLSITDIVTLRRVSSDIGRINHALAEYRFDRLAAIIPAQSHFDHAMDVGDIANRTNAVLLGSESTAFIARGANVPVDQYQILANGESRQFGAFTITLIESRHAPIGFGGNGWLPGQIEAPLVQPARITAWQEGVSYSILIAHPRGTALVQASGGFVKNNLRGLSADVAFLGIAGLSGLGREYVAELWHETVTQVGARRLFPIHYDDFTKPLGDIELFPDILDKVVETAGWIDDLAAGSEFPVAVERLPFGEAIVLY
jgi:L-ascorbate metabolism protein UlaG (beta-lactamase superfamily)